MGGRFSKRADERMRPHGTTENQKFFADRVSPRDTLEKPSVFNALRRFQPEKQKTCDPGNPHETPLFDFRGCHPMSCSSRGDECTIAATEADGVPDARKNQNSFPSTPINGLSHGLTSEGLR